MSGADEVVELGPRVTRVAEVLFDAFEVTRLVTVIRRGRITAAVGNVGVEIIDGRRDPDGGHSESGEIRHLLLNARQIATPVSAPVRFGRVVKPGALRRVVVGAAPVEEWIGDDLIDDFALEVGSGRRADGREENTADKCDSVQSL